MDITQHPFGQEEMSQLREYRNTQHDGRLKIRIRSIIGRSRRI